MLRCVIAWRGSRSRPGRKGPEFSRSSHPMHRINLDIRMLRSLTSLVETGSITETARRVGRTQPAITLQLQRLGDLTGKVLFNHEGRRLTLTPDGDLVFAYAKSILRLHDELLSQLSSPEIEGHVVL